MTPNPIRLSLFGAGLLALSAASASGQIDPSRRMDPDQLGKLSVPETPVQLLTDKNFVRSAGADSLAEIELGKLALAKSASPDVKALAQKMIDDHTQLNASLKPFNDTYDISVPKKLTKPDQAEYNKLNGLSGADFDKEYLAYMLQAHQKDAQAFGNEASVTPNPALATAARNGQSVISGHLAMIQKLSATS